MSDFFDTGQFLRSIQTQWVGRVLHYREQVDSTNSWAKRHQRGEASHGALYLTDDQQQGRGQYERTWKVEPGQNLTFSLVVRPSGSGRLTLLTLACALAMVQLEESLLTPEQTPSTIKWPNDVRHKGKKWVGILTETVFSGNTLERVVIGMGVNVNQQRFPGNLQEEATSLGAIVGHPLDREPLMAQICERIEYQYRRWHQQDATLIEEINRHLEGVGTWAHIRVDDQLLESPYFIEGVTPSGALKVHDQQGQEQRYSYEQIRIITD
jgi:BirA family biotin operon repressor/biotin-[acetyl-CoA-carboxylase] ligase